MARVMEKLYQSSSSIRLSTLVLFATIAMRVHAQIPAVLLLSGDSAWRAKSSMCLAGGDAGIASNGVDVEFLKKSLLGGHLKTEHLKDLASDMPQRTRVGYVANVQVELLNFRDTLFGNSNLGMRAALSTNYAGYVGFRPNLFRTVYLGNADYDDTAIGLGRVNAQNQFWQKFGFGLFNKKTLSGFTLSLVEGQSFQSLQLSQAKLYTSSMADSLSLSIAGNYTRSDTARSGWANGSGLGACLDFDYNVLLPDGSGLASLSVRNLGFVVWNEQSEQFTFDETIRWNGVNVSDWVSGLTDSISLPQYVDTLSRNRRETSFMKPLPASFHFRYLKKWKRNHYWETGTVFMPNRAAVPLVYAGMMHAITPRLWVAERLSYGGYGGLALGVEIQWLSKSSWFVKAGSSQLEGWLLPAAGGRNLFVNLGKNF